MSLSFDKTSPNGGEIEGEDNIGHERDIPDPTDFLFFVPWACLEFQLSAKVIVTKAFREDLPLYRGQASKSKYRAKTDTEGNSGGIPTIPEGKQPGPLEAKEAEKETLYEERDEIVYIKAVYQNDVLTQIKLEKNKFIPRIVLKVLAIAIKFHPNVSNITINTGVDMYTNYELSKILATHNLTELCLDGAYLKEGNYDILLNNPLKLKYLSLARCNINDVVVKALAAKLKYPLPASLCLSALNLASNAVTDRGAEFLALILRANRNLSYLNLSSNRLTDEGACAIFNVLTRFRLTHEEFYGMSKRCMQFHIKKKERFETLLNELIAKENKAEAKKKTDPRMDMKKKDFMKDKVSPGHQPQNLIMKARELVEDHIGDFTDPFDKAKTVMLDDLKYSLGNNTLCYLNLAYNSLSFNSVCSLLRVLEYQSSVVRLPRGILRICLDGNPIPGMCRELDRIESILESSNVFDSERRRSAIKYGKSTKKDR